MDGAAVGEHARQLVMRHARPVPNAAGVEVNERRARGRIEADAAALQAQAGKADLLQRHARNVEVHRVAEHVLAVARDARERRRSIALVAGERYDEMIWIGCLASTSR